MHSLTLQPEKDFFPIHASTMAITKAIAADIILEVADNIAGKVIIASVT